MDIARPDLAKKKRFRRVLYGTCALVVLLLVTVGISRLEPAAPSVERATLWIDTVKRGPMVRQVRGLGTLVPEEIRWIPATTMGRVERVLLRPGTVVAADSVSLELTNPALDLELQDAALRLKAVDAALANLRLQLKNESLQQAAATLAMESEYQKAALQAEVNQRLADKALLAAITLRQSKLDAEQLSPRLALAKKQLESQNESTTARIQVQQAEVDQVHAIVRLKRRQVDELRVRAGVAGVLQVVPVEVGQQVAPGANLARLDDVLFVGRRAFGQEQSLVGLFKVQPNGEAARTRVRLGRSSVNTVEVLSGLTAGDHVVLSDMSTWDPFDRIRLQ